MARTFREAKVRETEELDRLRQEKAEQIMVATSETIANDSRGRVLPLEALWRSPRDILNSYDFKAKLGLRELQRRLKRPDPEVQAVPGVDEVF